MGDLAKDTALEPIGDGAYRADLSTDWEMWGPNGGYLTALVLRVAGAYLGDSRRPAGLTCHFLDAARCEEVTFACTELRSGGRSVAVQVTLVQERPILQAIVWAVVADPRAEPQRTWVQRPDVPEPDQLTSVEELIIAEGDRPIPLLRNYEARPTDWRGWGPDRPAGAPQRQAWFRTKPRATFPEDPWLDAGRVAVGADIIPSVAIAEGFSAKELDFITPTMVLSLAFQDLTPEEDWLFISGNGVGVGGGLGAVRSTVWSQSGALVATGMQQMSIVGPS